MNVQRIPEYLLRWGVTLFGILLALYLVKSSGSGGYGKVGLAAAAVLCVTLLFTLRENIWILVPMCWPLTGTMPSLDIPFSLKDFVVMGVFAAMISFRAFKVITRRVPWTFENSLAAVMLLYMATVWIRNPVGVAALNSDRVGGRPYFHILIAVMAYWVIAQCSVSGKRANKFMLALVIGQVFESVIGQLLYWFPSLGPVLEQYYMSGIFVWAQNPDAALASTPVGEDAQRLGYLSTIGLPLAYLTFALYRPSQLLDVRRPYRAALFALAVICILLSGFRSALGNVVIAGAFSAYYWGGRPGILKVGLAGLLAVMLLIVGNGTLFNLPPSAQRALSFLPGRWDPEAIIASAESTRWRVDMWKAMMNGNRYIENKMLGDGFGFRKRDLDLMLYFQQFGDTTEGQESFLISGNVHSGPISTIRYAGYVGLAMILTLQIALARKAWKLMMKCRRTRFRSLGFFICLRVIMEPIAFVLIYGAFEFAIPEALFNLAMLHMLQNSLDDEEKRGDEKVADLLPAMKKQGEALPAAV
jgi:hypothetical protein